MNGRLQEGDTEVTVHDGDKFTYPTIQIEPKSVLKANCYNARKSSVFLQSHVPFWKRVLFSVKSHGIIHALETVAVHDYEESSIIGPVVQKIAVSILFLYNYFLTVYSSYFPYDLMTPDEQVQTFSRNMDWSDGIVRAFRWHPNAGKCAVALTNDDVLIYSAPTSVVPLLRHAIQKKVVDLAWKPDVKDANIIAVACQSLVVIWKIEHDTTGRARIPTSNARVLEKKFASPITSVSYDPTGSWLMICSPKTTKILLINESPDLSLEQKPANALIVPSSNSRKGDTSKSEKDSEKEDRILREWYDMHGFYRILWSPNQKRFVTCSTSNSIRLWEAGSYTSEKFGAEFLTEMCQACVWSKPYGRYMLIAPRNEAAVYAVPFYETAIVGTTIGRRSSQKVLDVSEYELPDGKVIGGAIHDMVWDQNSERLVISFRDNAEYLAAFRTSAKSILDIEPLGLIHGVAGETPLLMDFHDAFKKGSVLTICWSSGFLSHIPFQYEPATSRKEGDKKRVASVTTSTPRSLTSFCRSPILMSSPQASPIASQRPHAARSYMSFMSDDATLSFSGPHTPHHHMLSSDSVMSPRRPLLFSTMTSSTGKLRHE